jgi:hypothetical protein
MRVEFVASNNLLIVESQNDKFFIERLKQEITANFEVDVPICCISEYECLDGLSQTRLEKKLQEIKVDIDKRGLNRIGILLDADDKGIKKRINLINESVKSIDCELTLSAVNTWYKSELLDIEISCHILKVDGSGELETVLKAIKSDDSTFADCLDAWRDCVTHHDKEITDKDFDKFWVNIYQRYDCCSKKEKKQAGTKCNPEASLQKDIWDFAHPVLNDLKSYLAMFD